MSAGGEVAVRLLVSGRVQGVGFRYFTVRQARALGLAGRVRNLADGRVEVRARGSRESLDALAASLAQGPPASRVAEVTEQPLAEAPAWGDFDVEFL